MPASRSMSVKVVVLVVGTHSKPPPWKFPLVDENKVTDGAIYIMLKVPITLACSTCHYESTKFNRNLRGRLRTLSSLLVLVRVWSLHFLGLNVAA